MVDCVSGGKKKKVTFVPPFTCFLVPYILGREFSSVQFSGSVMSDSLRQHGLQHTRPHSPSPTHGACSDSCPLSWWCHLTISSSVIPFSSCLQSFPASGSYPMSLFLASGRQSIGASASASVLPKIFRIDFFYDWPVWSPCSPRDSQVSSLTPQFKSINSSMLSLLYSPTHIHIWLLEKP